MNTAAFVLIVLGVSLVCAVVAWILVARRYRQKIQEHLSIQEAIAQAQETLAALRKSYNETAKSLQAHKHELSAVTLRTKELVQLDTRAKEIYALLKDGPKRLQSLEARIAEKRKESEDVEREIHELKSELDLYSRIMDLVDFGIYEEPEYLHETSERYKVEIKRVRDEQKTLIREKKAIELPNEIQVEGSSQKGNAILAGQARVMLRAFNLECDVLIGKVNPSNFARTLERIEKTADELERSAISLMCGISTSYVKLKFDECRLQYEYKLKKAEEQEEQRIIREQMREEQKAIQEYQRAIDAAEREERMYEQLLERARRELLDTEESARADLEARVDLLETQLREAHDKGIRAQSLAEQTRRGHVYIISNIGSFGEDVYKIGLTRRLDPMDRVKELGDASVPFQFDVHAIVYSDDAPAMETALHRKFHHARVNAVNMRKEFFRVSLDDIRAVVDDICDHDVDFRMTVLAEEYFETRRLLGAASDRPPSPALK
ncbi:MAG TPA: DUF4041 domain-containing protein [Candidatus Hydrogenedentes bacterium]|nr:DUF4041 domain-containing protein [Candidatus Hydrogenedentota bacterium]